jgi:NitT/TauT family transport system substrate-binding protein
MKKALSVIMSFVMAAGLLAGCGGGNKTDKTDAPSEAPSSQMSETQTEKPSDTEAASESTQPTAEPLKLKVAYMPNYGSLWAVATAIEKGYMAEEGIELEMVSFQDGPTIISSMESGSVDIGYIGQGAHKLAMQGKVDIVAFSHIANGDAVIGGPEVKTAADLKGKKVGYSSGTSSEQILIQTLDSVGLSMNDITAMEMDASTLVSAMVSGSLDAVAAWSPGTFTILDEVEGATKISDNLTFADTTVALSSWIVMPKFAEERKADLERFMRALYKAMDYAADEAHYEEVAQFVADITKTSFDSVYQQRGDADWYTGKKVVEGVKDGTIKGFYELQRQNMIDAGAVKAEEALPVDDYVLFDIMGGIE